MSSEPSNSPFSTVNRRKFLISTATSASGLVLLGMKAPFIQNSLPSKNKQYTVQDIINTILTEGKLSPITDTVDTLKAGSPDQVVTGVVTTMFATLAVIEETAKRKANFIIAHEPTFYNHRDDTAWVNNNSIVHDKQALLEKYKIAVWRFHDYCHALQPDAISYGFAKKTDWLPYFKPGEVMLTIPRISLRGIVQHLKSSLGIHHVRIIGNPAQFCERIALLPGAWGGQRQINTVETYRPDVLVVGEVSEWETAEYIRDSNTLGNKTSLIILGHGVSEDPGMESFLDWLGPKLPNMPLTHLPSGDPFTWL